MSAFEPYKRKNDIGSSLEKPFKNDFFKFPFGLTSSSVLFGFNKSLNEIYNARIIARVDDDDDDAVADDKKTADEKSVEKKEKFFIKNLLKSDSSSASVQDQKRKIKRKFQKEEEEEEEASKMETLVSNLGKAENGHKCIYCGKIYSRKYGLKIHIRTHTGYKPLKCKYCLRPFGDPSNLNKHVRLHARGQTPYNCRFCGKILVRRRDLERHVKSKHGEEPS